MFSRDKFNQEIKNVLNQLISAYKPEKVILFGSLVDGEIKETTDIDIFIIKEDIPEVGAERIRQLDSMIKYNVATDFIVYKPSEVNQRLQIGDPFVKNILTKGRVLYEAA